ncbi:MAG TPA: hypothetical protein VMI56_00815 [Reyranella sp.]|nr:hypothetical protein [Reyranella sp.]
MKLAALLLTLLALLAVSACGNAPGADGRYATHDRGANNHM